MNLGKISFLKRVYLAITDFRMYPYTQKEKTRIAIGYFFKLLIFVSVIIGAFMTVNIFKDIPTIIDMYEREMPQFSIENGKMQTDEIVKKEINNDVYLIVDSGYVYDQVANIQLSVDSDNLYYVYVLSDCTVMGIRVGDTIQELAKIQYEPEMNFTKQQLSEDFKIFRESIIAKLMIWAGVSIGILLALLFMRVWSLIMYIISSYIINIMFGLRLKITEYLRVAIYVSTLPIILETIAILVVGGISESVNFISMLVSCVYIFYALRAIKLDSIILGGSGKNAEEKIKNALEHAQKELEKQLEELEKKEEAEKTEGKKEIEELSNELKEKEENLLKAQKEYDEALKKVVQFDSDKNENKDEQQKR